jgi:hypothetical protein
LVGLLNLFDVWGERGMNLTCLKMMLLADADPSAQNNEFLRRPTAFDDTLYFSAVVSKFVYSTMVDGSKHVQAAMKAMLDLGQPYVTANGTDSFLNLPPLLSMAWHYCHVLHFSLDLHEKIFLLLGRGTDVAARGDSRETCLHMVLKFDADITKLNFRNYQEEEFKDILMCMVTAGADVYASDKDEHTVSQIACMSGCEELWREVLAECGYNPDSVFSIEHDFNPKGFQKCPGIGVFSAAAPVVRSTKLSFKEYSQQRKSFDCVQKVYSREDIDIRAIWQESDQFWESINENSDSEDYDWVSIEEDDNDQGDEEDDEDEYGMEEEEFSSGVEESSDAGEA